jgi:hypothetical protein
MILAFLKPIDIVNVVTEDVGRSLEKWPTIYYIEFLRSAEGTISCSSRLHLQSLAPTSPHWARGGYGNPYVSLCTIHKEGLCPSSGGINGLMMMRYSIDETLKMNISHF